MHIFQNSFYVLRNFAKLGFLFCIRESIIYLNELLHFMQLGVSCKHFGKIPSNRRNQTSPRCRIPSKPLWAYGLCASPLPGRLWPNVTSTTKPEVHNVLHCRRRKTKPRLHLTFTEMLWSLDTWFFDICQRTDRQTRSRQTNRHTHRNTSYPSRGKVTRCLMASELEWRVICRRWRR